MSVVVGSIVLVQVGNQRVKARVTEYLSNDNILVYLTEHSLHGERTISVSLMDIVAVAPNPTIDTSITTINQIIPISLPSEPQYIGNTNIRRDTSRGGRKSRNKRLKHKRSKRY